MVLTTPGLNELKRLPFMKAIFTPPVSVDFVGAVAAVSAAGIPIETSDARIVNLINKHTHTLHGIVSAETITQLAKLLGYERQGVW